MSSIGPQLPPEPTKRKRSPHEDKHDTAASAKQARHQGANGDEIDLDSDADSDIGPFAPATTVIGPSMPSSTRADNGNTTGKPSESRDPRTAIGPAMPPASENSNEIQLDSESDSETGPPAPPSSTSKHPASGAPPEPHTDAQPASSSSSSSSDDDDDDAYGPSLPNPAAARRPLGPSLPAPETAPQRDSWMLAPPPSSSYSERDPTRMRARKFSSKPASSSKPSASEASIWTETPEEKLARQKDALLGRSTTTSAREADGSAASSSLRDKQKEKRDRRIAESIDAARGKSLLDEHKQQRRDHHEANTTTTKKQEDEEDDPSKRAFDREKDMAIGGKIGSRARQELISKSANFGGRFQKGSFL